MQLSATGAASSLLLEREAELQELKRLVEQASGGLGRCVLIEGPPGIGKTRLLEAARAGARQCDMSVLSARPSELEREFPYGVVRQLFEPVVASPDPDRSAALLHGAAATAATVLGHGAPSGEATGAGGDLSLAHFHALYWLAANLAEQAPVALLIDDLHWSDTSSLRFLRFLLPRLEELPVLVALAARPAEPGVDLDEIDALATDPLTVVLRPAPLSDRAVAQLVVSELAAEADRGFCDACGKATGGNPFLLRELLGELRTEGIGPSGDNAPLVQQLAPTTVRRTVLLRLARVGDSAWRLARAIAIFGDGTPLRRVAALAGLSAQEAGQVAGALAEAGILTSARPTSFAHPMLRSAVYLDVDPVERARAHRRAAAILAGEGAGPDEVAVHLLATDPAGDRDVLTTLREAAARAVERGAAPTAVAYLRRALQEPPLAAERGPLLLALGSAELQAGQTRSAAEHFEEGARVTPDPRTRATHVSDQALALQAIGRHDEAFAVRERAVEEVETEDPQLARLLDASLVASARFDLSRLDWARERLERYRGQLTGATPAERGLLAMQAHLDAFSRDCDAPAAGLADAAEAAIASDSLLPSMPGLATPFFSAVEVLALSDRLDPARRALDRALEDARRQGVSVTFAFTSGARSMLLARQGGLADAEADARTCAELSLSQGVFVLGPVVLGFVLEVLIDRGELEDAQGLLQRSGMATRTADHDLTFDAVVHARARLHAARGDTAGGRADLASLDRRRARWNTYGSLVPAVLAAPELADHEQEQARARAEEMLRDAETWGTPRAVGMALRAAGLVHGGAQGLALLEEAVAVLEPSPARLEYARALTDLGAALRRANNRATARDHLRRALDVADACGARPLARRARKELRAAGGRPRRSRISGVEALTASERRVAGMAAEGLSTPEIAQALFITKKTVETHLGSAYRKLDIHSRMQLPDALKSPSANG